MQAKLGEYRQAIAREVSEIRRLNTQMANRILSAIETELLQQELKVLRDGNLMESIFEEIIDLVIAGDGTRHY